MLYKACSRASSSSLERCSSSTVSMSQVWPTSWRGMSGPGSHGSNLDATRPSPGILCVSYQCHSMACLDRHGLEFGDKIIMPEAAFSKAHSLRLRLPLLFKAVNNNIGVATNGPAPYHFCGVLEFSAPRDQVFIPYWMMQKLLLAEGERVELQSIGHPPPGSFVRFRPHDEEFLVLAAQQGPKALMEGALRCYSVLSEGITILVQHEGEKFHLDVVEIRTQAASIPTEEFIHCSIGWDGGEGSRKGNNKRLVRSETVGHERYDQNVEGYSSISASSTVNGSRRVGLVSLLGDIDLEVEFCPRRVDSSEVGRASADRLRQRVKGTLSQEHQALTYSSISGCANDITEGKLLASGLALPSPTSARKMANFSEGSERTSVVGSLRSGPGKEFPSSAVSKRRSSRCRAFSGKGVTLGNTTCEVDSETVAGGDQHSWDRQPGLREDGTGTAVADNEAAGLQASGAALDTGRNESPATANRVNRKADGKRRPLQCRARPGESTSSTTTKATPRNLGGAEKAAGFNLNSKTDAYVCQHCRRCVPTANRTLHELRCFTVLATKDLHPPSSVESLRLQETWPKGPEKIKRQVTPGTEGNRNEGKTTPEDGLRSRQAKGLADDGNRDSITSSRAEGCLSNGVQTLGTACVSGVALDRCSFKAPEKNSLSDECSSVVASGKSAPSKESKKNGEVVPGHGAGGAIFPPQHGGHRNATASTPPPPCSFCGLSFRIPGAAAAHEILCGARTERCPTCGGYVPWREMESHRKPGGSCDATIAAAMAAEEEASFCSDSNAVVVAAAAAASASAAWVDYGSGGVDLRRCLYGMTKLDASLADAECSSKVTVAAAVTSIRDRHDNLDVSVLGAQCAQHQRRGITSARGGGGGRKEGVGMPDSIPMATKTVRAAGRVDRKQSFAGAGAAGAAATDRRITPTTLESEGGGSGRNHGCPACPHIPGDSFDVDEVEATREDEGATLGASTMTRVASLGGHFYEESRTLVNGGSRPTGSEVKVILGEVDATSQNGSNSHRCTRSGGVPVVHSRAPAAGDTAAFGEEQIIGVDDRKGAGVPGTRAVIGSAKDSWACSQCTLLNSLCADACDACRAVTTNAHVDRNNDEERRRDLTPPDETIAGIPSDKSRRGVDAGGAVNLKALAAEQRAPLLCPTSPGNVTSIDIATTAGFRPEIAAIPARGDLSGKECSQHRKRYISSSSSLTSSREIPPISGSSESQVRQLTNTGRDDAENDGAVVRTQTGLSTLALVKTVADSTTVAVGTMPRETRRCDAPTTEARAAAPGRMPDGQTSGTFVHSEAPPKRSIAGVCGAPRRSPTRSALHRQHVNHGPHIGELQPLPHQVQYRGVKVATAEKRLFQQGRDGNRRQGQPTSITSVRPRVPRSTTAALKTGRWGLSGNHRPSTLRHLPPVFRPRLMTDRGTPSLLPNDASVGIALIPADLSDVTDYSRFPYLRSSGTREESCTEQWQQKQLKKQQSNASNIPEKPSHIISRARSSRSTDVNSKGPGRALTTAPAAADPKATACDRSLLIFGNGQVGSSGAFDRSASRQGEGRSQPVKPGKTSSALTHDFPNRGLGTEGLKAQQGGRGHTGHVSAKLRRCRASHAGMVLEPLGSK